MVQETDFPHCRKIFSDIQKRFELAEQVAAYKHKYQMPIYAPNVESKIIAELESAALALNFEQNSVTPFILFLMAISVQRQEALFKIWADTNNTNLETPDLEHTLRPEIKALTLNILKQIKSAKDELKAENKLALEKIMTRNIHPDNMSDSNKAQLLNLLFNIKESI